MIVSVLVFHWGMGLSFVDAIYFIVTTVTTVGYGDISPRAASAWLKIYACFVMLLGSAMIATLFSVITDFIVASRFEQIHGRKAIPQSGHTIVVGLGNVGYRIVEELRKLGTSVVAVDRDANGQFVESVGTQVPVIIGDARLPNVLRKAGMAKAHAVIATTENDAVNLSVGLGARLVNPRLRAVIRLFDADFARKVRTSLKVDMALSSSLIAAPTFVASALYTGVQTAFTVGDHLLTIVHRPVGEVWAGRTPAQILEEEQVVILLRRRGLSSAYEPLPEETRLEKDHELIAAIWRKLDPLQVVKY